MAAVRYPNVAAHHPPKTGQYAQDGPHKAPPSGMIKGPQNGYLPSQNRDSSPGTARNPVRVTNGYITSHNGAPPTLKGRNLANGHIFAHGTQSSVPSRLRTPQNRNPLPHHRARDVYLRNRVQSNPQAHRQSSIGSVPDRARVPIPGLRPEVQNLWANQSTSAPQGYARRQLHGINENVIMEETEPGPGRGQWRDDHVPGMGVVNGPDHREVLAVPLKATEEAEDWGSLFLDNTLKEGQQIFHVPVILPNGRHITLTGEAGMRIKDLVSAAAMEYKLPECRTKLARTKAQLNDDADAMLVAGQQVQFEERTPAASSAEDYQSALLSEFLSREIDYLESLQSYFLTYEEPLSQLPSLTLEDKRLLFRPLRPFLKWSKRLLSQVGAALKLNPSSLRIANCFPMLFWQEYRNYYSTYKSIRELLNHLRETNEDFVEYCKELRGAARQSLDSLLLLPVQRVGQYDVFLTNLMEQTATVNPDYRNILTASSIVNKMVKEREEEVSQAENEARLLQVQERFPGDELCLFALDCFKAQKFKALTARRKSAPSAIKSALSSRAKSGAERSTQGIPASEANGAVPSSPQEPTFSRGRLAESSSFEEDTRRAKPQTSLSTAKRLYIMEGPVQVTVGLQTQVRYLFLFNDVLIIAKPNKSCTLFRLKHRLRVCELWLATCIQEVSEVNSSPETSFVLGWPTANNVLSFSSREERDLWWQSLSKHIEIERGRQESKSVSIRVCNRDEESKTMQNKTFQVEYDQTSQDVLLAAMGNFSLPQDQHESYQLWVQSGKEEELYPLIGHEYPHSIKMNHTRDAAIHRDDVYFPDDINHLSSAENELRGFQCVFILRKKGRSNTSISQDTAGIQRRLRRNKKSPFKLNFRRSLSGKTLPTGSSEALLFGKALSVVCTDGEPPQPIMDLLHNIYNNGPFTHGIFRKSANARVTKELKARLNAGEECDLTEIHVPAASSMLMDFLRSLPDCIFTGQLYGQWVLVNQLNDENEKVERIKSLLEQLPLANVTLLRFIFSIFHHVTLNSEENSMNHTNLAICTSPSMMWPPLSAGIGAQAQATKESPQLLQFMILHCTAIFGEEIKTVFGAPPIRKETVCPLDSGGDSDGALSKMNGSSMDSIEQDYGEDLEQNNNAQLKPWGYGVTHPPLVSPSSLSRDSGITSSDNQIYPDSDNTDTTDSGVNSQEQLNTILNSSGNLRFNQNRGYFTSEDVILAPTRRGRTGSDPSLTSPEIRKKMQLYPGGSSNDISPETMKMIADVSEESHCTLLLPTHAGRPSESEHRRSGYHPSERLHTSVLSTSKCSKSSSMEQMPNAAPSSHDATTDSGHLYARRVSAPSVPVSNNQPFSNRLSVTRQSVSSVSSSSSDRLSDGLSSSSTEKLFQSSPTPKADVTSSSNDYIQPRSKSVSPRGSKAATRTKSFMRALTPETTPPRPAPRLHQPPRPVRGLVQGREQPPSDYFPEAAVRSSLPGQDADDGSAAMKTIVENQEYHDRAPGMVGQIPDIQVSNDLPSYKEAVNNRRTQFKGSSHSMEVDLTEPREAGTPSREPLSGRMSAPNCLISLERHRSKGKDRRQVAGVYFHDSESSDDEVSDLENLRLQRSLSGTVTTNTNGHLKPRQVRRSSSDSKATSRRPSSNSSDRQRPPMHTHDLFYGPENVFESTTSESRCDSDRTLTVVERMDTQSPGKCRDQSNHVASPQRMDQLSQGHDSQVMRQSPSSPAFKKQTGPQGLRRSLERDPLSETAKANWQRARIVDSFDSGMSVDDFVNMDFDDESYV